MAGGQSVQASLAGGAKLAKQQQAGHTANQAGGQIRSKPHGGQAIKIVRQSKGNGAKPQEDHDFPALFFDSKINGSESRMFAKSGRNFLAQEPAGKAKTTGGSQGNAGDCSEHAQGKPKNCGSGNDEGAGWEKK